MESIEHLLQELDKTDDVYTPSFGTSIVVPDSDRSADFIQSLRKSNSFKQILRVNLKDGISNLPQGPYFLDGTSLHQAWRLYFDDLETFIIPAIPENPLQPEK